MLYTTSGLIGSITTIVFNILLLVQFKMDYSAPVSYTHLKRPDMWLICEDYNEARDNGYWLFKYIREQQPQQDVCLLYTSRCV